ncbi:SRPBCC family protein [Ectothiorhodospiraceae bacterium WFHF3C12]|nr:SRPBCC family protein [Ectothiorhodospiraceae bacterium WFHF3C12]
MVKVFVTSVIDAPASAVWGVVRGFNEMPDWHPLIARSRIEQGRPQDQIGCVRDFELTDGGRIREQLLSLSEFDYSFSYCILESPMPVSHYVAALRLIPVTDGDRTFAEWTAEFDTEPGQEQEMAQMIGQDVFQAGFDALKAHFGGRA